jgi:L-fuculose-phosphate aldolase
MPSADRKKSARLLSSYCNRLYAQGLVGSMEGNLSLKLSPDTILITPAGINKASVSGSDIIEISADGKTLSGKHRPSTEYRLHLAIYKIRPDIRAICHAHPIYATSFAIAGKPLDKVILPEVAAAIGLIPVSEFGIPGSGDLAIKVARLAKDFNSVLIRNHGVVTVGDSLEQAFNRMELTERYAQIYFLATIIGDAAAWPKKILKLLAGFDTISKQTAKLKSKRGN